MNIPISRLSKSGKLPEDEVNRGLALRTVSRLEAALDHSKEDTSALTRWLLGALVAMNLVAIILVALLAPLLDTDTVRQGFVAFSLGALTAFVAALVGALASVFITRMIRAAAGAWMEVAANDGDSAPAVAAARRMSRFANLWRAVLILAGLVSLLLLIAGGMVVAQSIASPGFRQDAIVAAPAVAGISGEADEEVSAEVSNAAVAAAKPVPTVVSEITDKGAIPVAPVVVPEPISALKPAPPSPLAVVQVTAPKKKVQVAVKPIVAAKPEKIAPAPKPVKPAPPAVAAPSTAVTVKAAPQPVLPQPVAPVSLPGRDDPIG